MLSNILLFYYYDKLILEVFDIRRPCYKLNEHFFDSGVGYGEHIITKRIFYNPL